LLSSSPVKTLEEITYEAGRAALDDQEKLVSGIRQRTGTLLAAHALVASFLGATTIRETGLTGWAWIALAALVLGLVAAAVLLAPWELKFAVDAPELYAELYDQAAEEAEAGTLGWLAGAGFGYQALRAENATRGQVDVASLGGAGVLDGRPDAVVADRPGGRLSAWLRALSRRPRSSPPRPASVSARVAAARRHRGLRGLAARSSAGVARQLLHRRRQRPEGPELEP
jgi:hypothetical protein